ncbi:hypothetical protein [Litoreibacter albidus]|uniref:5-carboxymethyl-2-hydroxymuconate isomerase n=1 Tax=Litoreibacter albidus TaxID=670155 RepID=A0A1H3B5N3_9RHOB|nr:hypothetical protein [Litoreibacter albidus]SDX37223.1 hypothetical protein SAMN04488001_3062 [Litoreibacter albidus]
MPHAEIKYSADMSLDTQAMMGLIETTVANHDSGAGAVKSRAYRVEDFQSTHVLITLTLLPKAHRDAAFMNALLADLTAGLKALVDQPCAFSLELAFNGPYYHTDYLQGAAT